MLAQVAFAVDLDILILGCFFASPKQEKNDGRESTSPTECGCVSNNIFAKPSKRQEEKGRQGIVINESPATGTKR